MKHVAARLTLLYHALQQANEAHRNLLIIQLHVWRCAHFYQKGLKQPQQTVHDDLVYILKST